MRRYHWMKQSRQENLTYLCLWGLLFLAPLLSLYVRTVNDSQMVFDWTEVLLVWRKFAVYLGLFLLHNFLLAPLLVHSHRRMTYATVVAVVVVLFTVWQCSTRPVRRMPMGHRPPPRMEMEMQEHKRPPHGEPRPMEHHREAPPPIVGERDILSVVVLILMLGANLGIKFYFRSRDDRKRLDQLQKENLEQQLEYLRYQVNPHFFMNTLNNIHALVDIDPEQAKETILELSKMMRFVLYEGNKQTVPVGRELDFIRHYLSLMQLRYTDKVRIEVSLPTEVPERQIPPLILITFIENAFKHGVTYQKESFIEITVRIEGNWLCFVCRNSKADKPNEEKGGVGLTNVRKRLKLIYGHDYELKIQDAQDDYQVELKIPMK